MGVEVTNDLQSILNPIPFVQWGMHIIDSFTPPSEGRKLLIVRIDYFTKLIKAKPIVKITTNQVKKFICQNLITRLEFPWEL